MKVFKTIAICLGGMLAVTVIFSAIVLQLYLGVFTPIHLYGRVVDADGNPVPAAQVTASCCQMFNPTIEADTSSDENGNFSVSGFGIGVEASVSKAGYYTLAESHGNFETWPPSSKATWPAGAGDYRHCSFSNPILFKLRKMGVCEPLIEHGGEFGTSIRITGDGAPISMDLTEGRAYQITNEDVRVQAWIQDQGMRPGNYRNFDWRFKVSVPGGGLQPRTGEFDFQAPLDGYEPSDEIVFSASDPKWMSSATREYFLKLTSGKYARIKLTVGVGGNDGFDITSYLNPEPGHRNLEYDPAIRIESSTR